MRRPPFWRCLRLRGREGAPRERQICSRRIYPPPYATSPFEGEGLTKINRTFRKPLLAGFFSSPRRGRRPLSGAGRRGAEIVDEQFGHEAIVPGWTADGNNNDVRPRSSGSVGAAAPGGRRQPAIFVTAIVTSCDDHKVYLPLASFRRAVLRYEITVACMAAARSLTDWARLGLLGRKESSILSIAAGLLAAPITRMPSWPWCDLEPIAPRPDLSCR